MTAAILSIGSEIMAGRIADTNAAFLSDRLTRLGFRVTRHIAVDDAQEEIVAALRGLVGSADVALVTGGIGPTPDDLTRQAFARFCGVRLVQHPDAFRRLREFFAARDRTPSASNLIQAGIPEGSDLLPNPRGTAAGFKVVFRGCTFFCMPGVPAEMRLMYERSVEPELCRMSDQTVRTTNLHVFGVPESVVGERLQDLMGEGRNPQVATQARQGVITIRLSATAPDAPGARRILDPVEQEVRTRMGDAVFGAGDDTLASAVARLLELRSCTLALAESCTGGAIAASLTDVPGISRFFLEAAVTYSNEAKSRRLDVPPELIERHGAVSAQVAEAMAVGIRRTSSADIGLAVTGIAGPAGATPAKPVGLVYIALADAHGVRSREERLAGERARIKNGAAKSALNVLRLQLEKWEGRDGSSR